MVPGDAVPLSTPCALDLEEGRLRRELLTSVQPDAAVASQVPTLAITAGCDTEINRSVGAEGTVSAAVVAVQARCDSGIEATVGTEGMVDRGIEIMGSASGGVPVGTAQEKRLCKSC